MPKTIKKTFNKKLTFIKLIDAHNRAKIGKVNKKEIMLFEQDLETNIINILFELKSNTYKLGKYRSFIIYEPKERLIKSLPYKDRIVHQWYVYEFIKPYILPRLITDTFACIDKRGTHLCVKKTQEYMKKMSIKYNKYYILKCDVKKYFYNINKDILFNIMKKYIRDKKLLNLTKILIYDSEDPKGIPIGNYTSQYYANIYLNELDHYVKEELKIKYYLRYMDDFVIMLPTKEECKNILRNIKIFLLNTLKLELNNKSRYYPNKFGINFCGYIIHENYILLRDRSKKKIKKENRNKTFMYKRYYGHLKHANCYNFLRKIIKLEIF